MKMNVYSICDLKAEEFGPLFLAKNDEIAFRMCKAQLKEFEYPEDYDLCWIGTFDTEAGELVSVNELDNDKIYTVVCNLADLFPKESK